MGVQNLGDERQATERFGLSGTEAAFSEDFATRSRFVWHLLIYWLSSV